MREAPDELFRHTKIGSPKERSALAKCLWKLKKALSGHSYQIRKSGELVVSLKELRPDLAYQAIKDYLREIYPEYDQYEATVFDLGIRQKLALNLHSRGFHKIRVLVELSADELREMKIGFGDEALADLRRRLADIGEYLVGDPIPLQSIKTAQHDRLLEQEKRAERQSRRAGQGALGDHRLQRTGDPQKLRLD